MARLGLAEAAEAFAGQFGADAVGREVADLDAIFKVFPVGGDGVGDFSPLPGVAPKAVALDETVQVIEGGGSVEGLLAQGVAFVSGEGPAGAVAGPADVGVLVRQAAVVFRGLRARIL